MNWEIVLASFASSLIELVEILGIVIVVGRLAGWRNALVGSGGGIALTLLLSLVLGKSLTLIPVDILRIVAGVLLLLFGQKWTRSIVRYYAGLPKKRKGGGEDSLEEQLAKDENQSGWNWFAVVTTFKAALLDSVEVAIAVVTLGAAESEWLEAISGAGFATFSLVVFAFLFRAPLQQVPVKPMKFVAAMLLMGFGVYWLGAGLDVEWPGGHWAIIWLPLAWGVAMVIASAIWRWQVSLQKPEEAIG
ncbi:COG4280 domain-containing protein [Nostoc sp. UCD121]|uniref:COG4280 domain-containing protein n=1 Tax=unclassified Nostoc TaxID=2593658 RepID=UPI001623BDD0|nr:MULTISPECIES: COG4280 domain-containing protein [unclassified Nostoc]MBC1225049.1 COG4280 domain-containing protein [Nostoc sp. UCD120]MBC1278359.1 COG4280 domain-containing protein [Nostoc sp. UCD121]